MERMMRRMAALAGGLLLLGGCARTTTESHPILPAPASVNINEATAKWQYPGSKSIAGGTTSGLHSGESRTPDPYEKVWEYYAKKVGYPGAFRADALDVGSECTTSPCTARAVTSANVPGLRSATFAFKGAEGGVVVTVRRADSAALTTIQLTIIVP